MKKKKQEQVNLFEVKEETKELKPIVTKENVVIGLAAKCEPRLITINHYFQASELDDICRLCSKHGRHAIHGRKRK